MKNRVRLAFDLGGSSIKYTCDELTTIFTHNVPNISKKYVLNFISELANLHCAQEICISAPGIIDSLEGKITGLSAIAEWKSNDIFDEIRQLLNNKSTKIYIDNDGNCALLGCIYKTQVKVHSALSIVIGTGIGGSYFSDNKINKGFANSMGELGMMFSSFENDQNISTVLSTNALCNVVNTNLNTQYNGQEIFEAYESGSTKVIELVELWVNKNAKFIYNVIWAFDPEYIFIGGAIASNKTFEKLIIAAVSKIFRKINMSINAKIVFANQGNKLNLLGALLLSDSYKINNK